MISIPIALSTFGIVLIAVAGVLLLLFAGGYAAITRRTGSRDVELLRELDRAERALAQASALDRGWDRAVMDAAARDAAAARFGPGSSEPLLVEVIDKPGTDEDQAVYRVETADGDEHRITLGRTGDRWGPV